MFEYRVSEDLDLKWLHLKGRIDSMSAVEIQQRVEELILAGERILITDFEEVNYISSAGLRVFLAAQKQLGKGGGEIILFKIPPKVLRIFEMSGFEQLFRITSSKKDIQSALQAELTASDVSTRKIEGIPVQYVPVEKINRITRKNHQGVIAILSIISYARIEQIIPSLYESGEVPFIILLDGITDVRNLGAIIRTAESAGAHTLIIPEKGSATPNTDTIKTSAGALFHLPICRTKNLKYSLNFLKESGLQIIAAHEEAETPYYMTDFTLPSVIILGAEDKGISKQVMDAVDQQVNIPMAGKTSSLNVSVAGAILMYEVVRQRTIAS